MKRFKVGGFKMRLDIEAVDRPPYAYGMLNAALQARELNIQRIAAIEFGVAGGNGLIAMNSLAKDIEAETGVRIDVYGFDAGAGLPESSDYRDQKYFWRDGAYPMNIDLLYSKLERDNLILGDVKITVKNFFKERVVAPIGFIAFDLDYYTSSKYAFNIFKGGSDFFLPRVECYMDDVSSYEILSASSETGVLKAISDYNREAGSAKILKKMHVSRFRRIPFGWNECMYVHHFFDHSLYNFYVGKKYNQSLDLNV